MAQTKAEWQMEFKERVAYFNTMIACGKMDWNGLWQQTLKGSLANKLAAHRVLRDHKVE